ncbi:MAG: histidine phosphatase family protein [Myxococcota bacterium]
MKIYLVRHARSVAREDWLGDDDELRPLNEVGREQAEALAAQLAADPPTRILSATSVRCQQTVQALSSATGVEVEIEDRLASGEDVARALELLPTFDEGPLLLCTYGDVIGRVLRVLELVDADRPECRKGALWVLEGQGYTPTQATYVEPAATRRRRETGGGWDPAAGVVRAAVLDLGSTSFNLLIADVPPSGRIAPVVRDKVMLRLGAMIANGGAIPDEVVERACDVARELAEVARREKVERFFPVATAAIRAASNGADTARRIGAALGHPIRILSGEEEARTIFRAFQHRVDLGNDATLGLDLGGGSLELAVGSRRAIDREVTTPLGVVRLQRELVANDPITKPEVRAIRERVRSALADHRDLASGTSRVGVATGGTVRALARLLGEKTALRGPRPKTPRVALADLAELRRTLVRSTHAERLQMRGSRRHRADLVVVGAIVLEAVARELELDAYRVCDWGLREGVLLEGVLGRGALPDGPE